MQIRDATEPHMQHTRLQVDNGSSAPHPESRSLQPQYVQPRVHFHGHHNSNCEYFETSQNLDWVVPECVAVLLGRAIQRRISKWETSVDVTVQSRKYQSVLAWSNQGRLLRVAICPLGGGGRRNVAWLPASWGFNRDLLDRVS